ncbi:DUF4132 domain-containing protein [Nocardia tengchongensis]|uniref:DUF4132 domain-containing protein n=1 Tax=Nocardia tengchongensis TaxID=2055889 RepID=A0ABX8CW85_9NOCA|nr:DUF4132 domain-containing protein [Nocardia tengchongensis]QVI23877.1 DUF4132 domain-containing protein [Nocardia tengchongensis]
MPPPADNLSVPGGKIRGMTDGERRWADPHATEAVRKLLRRHRAAVETVLTAARVDGLDELADAAAEYIAAPDRACAPEGAAIASAIAQHAAVAYRTGARREQEFIDRFIDSWMIEHGHVFTTGAAVARLGIRVEEPEPRAGRMTPWLRVTAPGEEPEPAAEALHARVRERLGEAPEITRPDATRVAVEPKSVTTEQIRRLEAAMVDGRRWRAAAYRRLVLEDPALGQVARLLAWASFDSRTAVAGKSAVAGAFRVDAEGVLLGADDQPVELPGNALVGVAHPIHLGDSLADWRKVFDDNRLRQPFEQLERRIHTLTAEEAGSNLLSRFTDRQIRTDRVFGLQQLGWEVSREILIRRFGPAREVRVTLEPGFAGGFRDEPELQRVLAVELRGGTFGVLDPVTVSELIRQLERLAA